MSKNSNNSYKDEFIIGDDGKKYITPLGIANELGLDIIHERHYIDDYIDKFAYRYRHSKYPMISCRDIPREKLMIMEEENKSASQNKILMDYEKDLLVDKFRANLPETLSSKGKKVRCINANAFYVDLVNQKEKEYIEQEYEAYKYNKVPNTPDNKEYKKYINHLTTALAKEREELKTELKKEGIKIGKIEDFRPVAFDIIINLRKQNKENENTIKKQSDKIDSQTKQINHLKSELKKYKQSGPSKDSTDESK